MLTETQLAQRASLIASLEADRAKAASDECEVLARIGETLAETKAGLPRGAFGPWVEGRLPFGRATAYRLLKLASRAPALRRFFALGRCAVYALMRLSDERLATLAPDQRFEGVGLAEMDCRRIESLVRTLLGQVQRVPTPADRARGYVEGLRRLAASDPGAFDALRGDLARLIECRCPEVEAASMGGSADAQAAALTSGFNGLLAGIERLAKTSPLISVPARLHLMAKATALSVAIDALPPAPDTRFFAAARVSGA